MRRWKAIAGIAALILSGAAFAGIDLSDFDKNTMQDVDDANKELESALSSKETRVAVTNAEFIRDSLHWAEGYFDGKGNAADAVKLARQGRELAATIAKSAGEGNFDAATEAYSSLRKTCKSCHDAYKPPSL
ncbi:MAG: cytochrome c [Gammaproteobacteria bacterium]